VACAAQSGCVLLLIKLVLKRCHVQMSLRLLAILTDFL